MNKRKNIITVLVLALIISAITYLEVHKQKTTTVDAIPLELPSLVTSTSSASQISIVNKAAIYQRAVELTDPQGFINTPPFTLQSLVGHKVVLIDFWTYSCINCQRTIPYLNAWYQKYRDLGLVIVGVHTPEFDFEKDLGNVQKAVKDVNIGYPVVLDSKYGTWNAYKNRYWPHELLIDIDGYIVHDHIGEGGYNETEVAIQKALKERSARLSLGLTVPTTTVNPKDAVSLDTSMPLSPETYFGSARSVPGSFILQGTWDIKPEYAESASTGSSIFYTYFAKNVYMVASSKNGATITIKKDGVVVNTLTIKDNTLYHLIQDPTYGSHSLEVDINGTLDAFTLTFG